MNYVTIHRSGTIFFMRRRVIPDATTGEVPGTETPVSTLAGAAASAAMRLWIDEHVPVNAQLIICLGQPGEAGVFARYSGLWSATVSILGRKDLNVQPGDQCSATDEGVIHVPSSRPAAIVNVSQVVWRGRDQPWITMEYVGEESFAQECMMVLFEDEWRIGECIPL